jgi:hypothetical protein
MLFNGGRNDEIVNNILADDPVSLMEWGNCSDMMIGNRIERNIFFQPVADNRHIFDYRAWGLGASRTKEAMEEMKAHPAEYLRGEGDLFWMGGKPPAIAGLPWDDWIRTGAIAESRVADPLFINASAGDFHLNPDSPAHAIGFRTLPTSDRSALSRLEPASLRREAVSVRYDSAHDVERKGMWTEGDDPLALGGGTFHDRYLSDGGAAKGEKWIRFTLHPPRDGAYEIHLRWTNGADRSAHTPVDIVQGASHRRIFIDQRYRGFMWVPVATDHFHAGEPVQITVLTEGTTGFVTIEGATLIRDPSTPSLDR